MNQDELLLSWILVEFGNELIDTTRQYKDGEISKDEWHKEFLYLLAFYLTFVFMAGLDTDTLDPEQERFLDGEIYKQRGYLDNFADDIDTLTEEQATTRANLYASSVTTPYWQGRTWRLKLPAMPGDGTSECLQFDKCQWQLHWLDHEKGNVDAYWVLGDVITDHCPTCLRRAVEWNPLRIRNWMY